MYKSKSRKIDNSVKDLDLFGPLPPRILESKPSGPDRCNAYYVGIIIWLLPRITKVLGTSCTSIDQIIEVPLDPESARSFRLFLPHSFALQLPCRGEQNVCDLYDSVLTKTDTSHSGLVRAEPSNQLLS